MHTRLEGSMTVPERRVTASRLPDELPRNPLLVAWSQTLACSPLGTLNLPQENGPLCANHWA